MRQRKLAKSSLEKFRKPTQRERNEMNRGALRVDLCVLIEPVYLKPEGAGRQPIGYRADKNSLPAAQAQPRGEHPFRAMKCVFDFTKVRYRGIAKNTNQLFVLYGLINSYRIRRPLLALT